MTLTASKGTANYNAATRVWTVNVGVLGPNETVTVVITAKTIRLAEIPTGKPETCPTRSPTRPRLPSPKVPRASRTK